MRLINTTTIQLHEFLDDQIPLYVILSHRWEEDEVMFRDLNDGKGVRMKGYAKILGCCAQAREDGFEFAWIDSCCIDKTSSAELSEAINSMFQWYQNAQMCYAYLSDVPAIKHLDHYRHDSEFRRSKWFTRGWTLQELLAPEIVIFYNQDWLEIGTKTSLDLLISSITNIESSFLTNAIGLAQASVAQKMSWTSKRKTTRLEDIAYCLVGLFGVNMPLLYGEGTKAFYRLQLEIIRTSPDESIFAWGRIPETDPGPYPLRSRLCSIFAEDPESFQDSGGIVSENSLRPSYTITNKGLQMMVDLIERLGDSGGLLRLHCHQRGDDSNNLAIYLNSIGYRWARDTHLLPSLPRLSHPVEQSDFQGEIIILSNPDIFISPPDKWYPGEFFLDVSAVTKCGYSVRVRMNYDQPREIGRFLTRFESVDPEFRMLLECKKPQDTFCLVLTRHPQRSQRRGFCIGLDGDKACESYENKVLLPSGGVAKAVQKRKVELGKLILVAQILIEEKHGVKLLGKEAETLN